MSPHEYMTILDKEGTAYTVSFNVKGFDWTFSDKAITEHCGKWFSYESDVGKMFISFDDVSQFAVKDH